MQTGFIPLPLRSAKGPRARPTHEPLNDLPVFDEPTNHLDIETQDVLLGGLGDFPGGVLLVSHDRHFVDEPATGTLRFGIT